MWSGSGKRISRDKNFLFRRGSIGGLFLLVKEHFSSVLYQKAGTGDAVGG